MTLLMMACNNWTEYLWELLVNFHCGPNGTILHLAILHFTQSNILAAICKKGFRIKCASSYLWNDIPHNYLTFHILKGTRLQADRNFPHPRSA